MRLLLETHVYLWWLENSETVDQGLQQDCCCERGGFQELPITAKHAAAVCILPDIHHDPFDRLLVAQAMCEPLKFLTQDSKLKGYSELIEII